MGSRIVYYGRVEIGRAVGVPYKEVSSYVKHHGLPAFKINGKGHWIALPEDLEVWIRDQRDRYLRRS